MSKDSENTEETRGRPALPGQGIYIRIDSDLRSRILEVQKDQGRSSLSDTCRYLLDQGILKVQGIKSYGGE